MWDRGASQAHRREQVGSDGRLHGCVVDLEGAARRRASGVGDQHVEAAEALDRLLHEPGRRARVRDVRHHRPHLRPIGGSGLHHTERGLDRLLAPATDENAGALLGQRRSGGETEPAGARRHQRHAPLEAEIHALSPPLGG